MIKNHTKGEVAMVCPKCYSENVNVQVINVQKIKNKHHGLIWWLCIGWWWWMLFTLPALVVAIFAPKRQKIKNKQKSVACCQACGFRWNV
jgi:hypothetical protein